MHPDEKVYETRDVGDRQFFFEDEDRIGIRFNPKENFKVIIKEYLSNLFLGLIAGIVLLILEICTAKNYYAPTRN